MPSILITFTILIGLNAISWLLSKEEKKPWPIFPVCFGAIGFMGPWACAGTLSLTTAAILCSLSYAVLSGASTVLAFEVP